MKRNLISIRDLSSKEIEGVFVLTDKLKKDRKKFLSVLEGKTLALIFQKPSNRTRVSFEVGMYQLGGNAIYLSPGELNLGVRESVADVARTLSRYVDGIVLRTFAHQTVVELARAAGVPVINGLSDFSHPCQALADIYTAREKFKDWKKIIFAYVGDGNNVCNSLLFACAKLGITVHVATPAGYEPDTAVVESCRELAGSIARVRVLRDPREAVRGAAVVYTDVWTSMGQEKEARERRRIFRAYQVNAGLMALAHKRAVVMHCLPAHRGEEITDDVIDSGRSVVFDQAENRMHVQKAILITLMGC